MFVQNWARSSRLLALIVSGGLVGSMGLANWASGQAPAPADKGEIRMAERSGPATPAARLAMTEAAPNEHPLMPALRWAREVLHDMDKVKDYSATVVKQERVDGKVGEPEFMFVKLRHKPFSVYMCFLKPEALKGQEVIFVQGANNGKLLGHGTGLKKHFGTVPLDPNGPIAMRGNHYPITELGVLNLTRRLIEVGEKDTQYGECEVNYFPGSAGVKVNDRVCTCVQIVHPVPRRTFLFHVARIFVDEELNIPIRYEAYDWPEEKGGQPEMIESYTYLDLKVNNGFTDADFDVHNPNYGFKSKK